MFLKLSRLYLYFPLSSLCFTDVFWRFIGVLLITLGGFEGPLGGKLGGFFLSIPYHVIKLLRLYLRTVCVFICWFCASLIIFFRNIYVFSSFGRFFFVVREPLIGRVFHFFLTDITSPIGSRANYYVSLLISCLSGGFVWL